MGYNYVSHVKPKSLLFLGKIYLEKKRNRIRISPIPVEASWRFIAGGENEGNKDIIVMVRKAKEKIMLPLPSYLVVMLKHAVLKKRISEEDLRFEIGFLAYEYVNVVIHLLGLDSISIMHRAPEVFNVRRDEVDISREGRIERVVIRASGFIIYPLEKPTNRISFYGQFFDVRDEIDYENFSGARFELDLYGLMKELKIRWDIGVRY